MMHVFKVPGCPVESTKLKLQSIVSSIKEVDTEYCYNIEFDTPTGQLSAGDMNKLIWLLSETFEPDRTRHNTSFLLESHTSDINNNNNKDNHVLLEFGPRLAFTTAWSSNCITMCNACGIKGLTRVERSRRYLISSTIPMNDDMIEVISIALHDRMTECRYITPMSSFNINSSTNSNPNMGEANNIESDNYENYQIRRVPIMAEGKKALESINEELGLGFDNFDLDFYTQLFRDKLKRDPSDVECFDMGQSNSEHSRHWFFGGKQILDNIEQENTLFKMVKATLKTSNQNSIIAFHDNSSVIEGTFVDRMRSEDPTTISRLIPEHVLLHPLLTAETHNFPTGVAPFAGAETGTGGRLRDVQATGRGAHTIAGICGYCVGQLLLPELVLPWEDQSFNYASNLAHPRQILIEASDGASDYGNKYGEPVIQGFTRSYGHRLPSSTSRNSSNDNSGDSGDIIGERFEWVKPIMFTAGLGLLDGRHCIKGVPQAGMIVCKAGGPAYRIGMGGGAASSKVAPDGDSSSSNSSSNSSTTSNNLDFNAVQRGDAEMENRLNRVIRGLVEMGDQNPIVSIHDQGAGGNGNVLKEIVEPLGAEYVLKRLPIGDPTMSCLEMWGAEYQENNAFLIHPECLDTVLRLADRENCAVTAVGRVTESGRVVAKMNESDQSPAVDLPLELVLGDMPQKIFRSDSAVSATIPLEIPLDIINDNSNSNSCGKVGTDSVIRVVARSLKRVMQLVDVGSKRFLTNKVDRSVGGLIAQQQCVGPLHTPLSNVGVTASAHIPASHSLSLHSATVTNTTTTTTTAATTTINSPSTPMTGIATAVGEQPIKGLLSPEAQARMTVGEALTNMMFAPITSLEDVKASGNWMWAAKAPHEGCKMWNCCTALCAILKELGVGIDGGKDSLSMSARVSDGEIVKSPGQLSLTVYASCTNVDQVITPDFKSGNSRILYIDLGRSSYRLGGSALSTVYAQLGRHPADVPDVSLLSSCFKVIQTCLRDELLLSGHDRSDGGLLVSLLEMAMSGDRGFSVDIPVDYSCDAFKAYTEGSSIDAYPQLRVLFGEELGIVLEVEESKSSLVMDLFREKEVPILDIGSTNSDSSSSSSNSSSSNSSSSNSSSSSSSSGSGRDDSDIFVRHNISLKINGVEVELEEASSTPPTPPTPPTLSTTRLHRLRTMWEETSFMLERRQCNPICVDMEQTGLNERHAPQYSCNFSYHLPPPSEIYHNRPRVAILRQEGTNGDREMAAAFYLAGMDPWDVCMSDLLAAVRDNSDNDGNSSGSSSGSSSHAAHHSLSFYQGLVFCGGFSYADVNDSAKGWAGVIHFNPSLKTMFDHFRTRRDSFSLGVCNGCQLMALLGWVPFDTTSTTTTATTTTTTTTTTSTISSSGSQSNMQNVDETFVVPITSDQPRFIHNTSERFESRWSTLTVLKSNSVLLHGMEGATIGVWVAHGEGKLHCSKEQLHHITNHHQAPLRYVDDNNCITTHYPENPNGSPDGIAALLSPCGRHLAMMPHPERCFANFQIPYASLEQRRQMREVGAAPWIRMFTNAAAFCKSTANSDVIVT